MNDPIGKRKRLRAGMLMAVLVSAAMSGAAHAASAPAVPATPGALAELSRQFGHVIGDIVTQRVLLEQNGHRFEPGALPRAERVGVWFERRTPHIESTPDGRRWLVIDYQIVNAPQTLVLLSLPAWDLASGSGGVPLHIAAQPISVSPLSPHTAFAKGGLDELLPDRPAPTIDTAPIRRQLVLWSAACLLTLLGWLLWWRWRNWRADAHQPFARALRELRHLDDNAPEAWQALHRAFDRTAGQIVQLSTLPVLFEHRPQLAPQRAGIEQFYRLSSERFFGAGISRETGHTNHTGGHEALSIHSLCQALRRIEKGIER